MYDGEEQKRLVTTDLSVDFELLNPVNVRKRKLLVKTGKYAKTQVETQRYECLRSLNADRMLDTADWFSHGLRSDAIGDDEWSLFFII